MRDHDKASSKKREARAEGRAMRRGGQVVTRGRRGQVNEGKPQRMESRIEKHASTERTLMTLIGNKSSARLRNREPRCASQTELPCERKCILETDTGVEEIKRG